MKTNSNLHPMEAFLPYLDSVLQTRLALHFGEDCEYNSVLDIPFPSFTEHKHPLLSAIKDHALPKESVIVILLALIPHIFPDHLDKVIQESLPEAGDFPQLGGMRGKNFRGFLPTGETALFLLAGTDIKRRLEVYKIFHPEGFLSQKRILWLEEVLEGEPVMSGKLILAQEYVELFSLGEVYPPQFSLKFPAQKIDTPLDWSDLILAPDTLEQIRELEHWINYSHLLMDDWQMKRKLKPGYRVLFHGPPGTGKTLTASLLGKYTSKPVYKIDLSMVVSKFIGETEKNLSNLLAKAENKDWILFFDEADALFGKRTQVKDAHDKYANQEVSYLLQRIEGYHGLVILASNIKSNIDDAFIRRFQAIISFPLPKSGERLKLWEKAFPKQVSFTSDVNLKQISTQYELSGAEIMNIVQYTCLKTLARQDSKITHMDLYEGIRREYQKEGKIIR